MKCCLPEIDTHDQYIIKSAPGSVMQIHLSVCGAPGDGEKIKIIAGARSSLTIIDDCDLAHYPEQRLEIIAQPYAQVKFIRDYSNRSDASCVRHETYWCMRHSMVESISVQRAGGERFLDSRVYSNARFFARDVYLLDGAQTLNAHTTHEHVGKAGVADSATLAIVRGGAQMKCEGAIIAGKAAKNAVSSLQQKVILSGQGSCTYAAPTVALKQGTVRCTHSVACSQLDDELTWMLSARGTTAERAVELLLHGMVREWVGGFVSEESIKRLLDGAQMK